MTLDGRLAGWLRHEALPGRRIVLTSPLSGGFRNDNLLLVDDVGDRFVLRQWPQANTCAMESALLWRLAGVVPVPSVVAADPDLPAMVYRFVPGTPLSEVLPSADRDQVRELGYGVGRTLAAIGTVTFDRPGSFTGGDLVPDGVEPTEGLAAFVERCLRDGNAREVFTAEEIRCLLQHAANSESHLSGLRGSRRLVHSDFNPKNLLVADGAVVAVLDWEFALASSPLIDVGNLLRFEEDLPPGFADAFVAGFAESGGHLPTDWRAASLALDLFALADFLTRPPDHPFFARAVTLIRRRLEPIP